MVSPETTIRRRAPLFWPALFFSLGCWLGTIPIELTDRVPTVIYLVGGGLWIFLASGWAWGAQVLRSGSFLGIILLTGWIQGLGEQLWLRGDNICLAFPRLVDESVTWRGKVVSLPEVHPRSVQFYLELNSAKTPDHAESVTGRILVRLRRPPTPVGIIFGQTVEVSGLLDQPMLARNPGQLDYRRYLLDHGVSYLLSADYSELHILTQKLGWNPVRIAAEVRDWAGKKLTLGLKKDPTVSAILAGMVFGDVEEIPVEIDNAFRTTGTYHIFAVSGQNLAELLGLGILVLQVMGLVRWRWGWLLAPVLVFYCLVSDNQPSIIRALVMGLLVLLAWRLGRPLTSLNLWATTLLLIMGTDPRSLRDLGFLLSFVVVLALILFSGPIIRWLQGPWEIDPFIPRRLAPPFLVWRENTGKGISALVGTSLAAWLGSVPLMWLCFHQLSLVAILANLLVVPLAGLIVIIGTLSIVAAVFSSVLTVLCNNANWLAVKIMLAVVMWMARWPGASSYVADPTVWGSNHDPHFTITQSGSSQSILLRYRGQNWLINPGSENDYRFLINPMRKFYGINHWDGVVLAEYTSKLIGGSTLLANETTVGRWWIPPGAPHFAKMQMMLKSLPTQVISQGLVYHFDADFTLKILSPEGGKSYSRAADGGLVLLFEYQGRYLLVAGSIGFGLEQQLVLAGHLGPIDILVQGRHPNEPNLSTPWLSLLRPTQIVLAAASPFQPVFPFTPRAPGGNWRPAVIWDQTKTGAIEIVLRGGAVEMAPFLKQPIPKQE